MKHARLLILAHAAFDLLAFCSLASRLRGGIPCVCDPLQKPMSGSLNGAVLITFDG